MRALDAGRETRDYPAWEKVRRRTPPEGLSSEQWWAGIKLSRLQQARPLSFVTVEGQQFSYVLTDSLLEALDDISRRASGAIATSELVTSEGTRDRYLVRSLMEEAITSSQLEGAVTTRRDAKEMLRQGRQPRDRSERMIVNNYRAMQFVRDHLDEDLTPELVCQLHRIVSDGTLDNPNAAGRLQMPGEPRVGVWTEFDDVQLHQPPPAEQLPDRLAALCGFANGRVDHRWLPPLLRAIVTHFMTGYDHYFVDGNGRLARALFYWVALRNGFWLLEFTAISRVLKGAPAQYAKAYLHTEQDGGDLTYFALHQVGVIQQSLDDLHTYLREKARQVESSRERAAGLALNHRQLAVVEGILRNERLRVTARSHAASHNVTLATSRSDLRGLEELGLMISSMEGRAEVWSPVPRFAGKLDDLAHRQPPIP